MCGQEELLYFYSFYMGAKRICSYDFVLNGALGNKNHFFFFTPNLYQYPPMPPNSNKSNFNSNHDTSNIFLSKPVYPVSGLVYEYHNLEDNQWKIHNLTKTSSKWLD